MRISDALTRLLDPSNPVFVTGDEASRQQARQQWRRERYIAQITNSNLRELRASNLVRRPFGIVEDTTDGRLYRARRDELGDIDHATGVVAYYTDEAGAPHLLEEPPGPQTRQGVEARQAEREQRRNQPKPKPSWMQ